MSAPKGNQFWKARSTHGRKPIFPDPDTLWEACTEYFEWVEANPLYEDSVQSYQGTVKHEPLAKMRAMTLTGLYVFLDIDHSTWDEYRKREGFSAVTTRVDQIIRDQKFAGAAAGLLNANIIARDLGLAEKQEHTGKDGGAIQTESLSDLEAAKRIAFLLTKASVSGAG